MPKSNSTIPPQAAEIADSAAPLAVPEIEQPFVSRWSHLISTTNWEKGRIIHEWREALIVAGASTVDYSDESWSRRVGGVSSQHVGRLRRVFQKFGESHDRFRGLYWSHFQAAVDWDDAEMWLEGAVQNSWPVSAMRRTRWETLGSVPADQPRDEDIVRSEVDEDWSPERGTAADADAHYDNDARPTPEGPDFGDDEESASSTNYSAESSVDDDRPAVAPFENLAELPPDLADAFDAFKLAILRHKADAWQQIAPADVLASLDALKELVA